MAGPDRLKVSLAQISPHWLDRAATLEKVNDFVRQAAGQGSQLVAFGEGLVPGYPFWPELTNGAEFESSLQRAGWRMVALVSRRRMVNGFWSQRPGQKAYSAPSWI